MPVVVVAVATESQCEFVVIIAFCITIYSDILTDHESVFDIIVSKIGIVVGFVMCYNFNICSEFLAIFFYIGSGNTSCVYIKMRDLAFAFRQISLHVFIKVEGVGIFIMEIFLTVQIRITLCDAWP